MKMYLPCSRSPSYSSVSSSDHYRSRSRSKERLFSPTRTRNEHSSPRRSRDRRSTPERSRERRASPVRTRERLSSPRRSRELRSSPLRGPERHRERRPSPARSQDRWPSSQRRTSSSAERLAKKLLESSGLRKHLRDVKVLCKQTMSLVVVFQLLNLCPTSRTWRLWSRVLLPSFWLSWQR